MEEAKTYLFRCARLNGQPVGEDSLSQEVRVTICVGQCTGVWWVGSVPKCPFSWARHI